MRSLRSAVLSCLALIVPAIFGADAGALDGAKPYLGALFPFHITGNRLALDLDRITSYRSVNSKREMTMEPIGELVQDVMDRTGVDKVSLRREARADQPVRNRVFSEARGLSCSALLAQGGRQVHYDVSIKETAGGKRKLSLEFSENRLQIEFRDKSANFKIEQKPDGTTTLDARRGSQEIDLKAASFIALLKSDADKAQIFFLRPLADLGITLPPHRYLPPVMAVATGAFDPPPPEVAKKADELIAALAADDMDVRENACRELIALFPRAIFHISQAVEKAQDAEVKACLNSVVAAHPGIAKARAFVEKEKLHENREYLLDLLANVPFFKAAARARLAVLLGKDYGDDAAQWPK